MAFYTGDKFPAWRGSILVGALAGKLVSRLETDGDKVTGEERMLKNSASASAMCARGRMASSICSTRSIAGPHPADEARANKLTGPWKMKAAPAAIRLNPIRWFQPSGSFEVEHREAREDHQGDHLLHGLELGRRIDLGADAVGGHGKPVFEEGDAPADT